MKFKIAKYKNFQEPDTKEFKKVVNLLSNGDFKSADSKKLSNSNYFRAKIDIKGRLIFQFGYINNVSYIFLLELLLNHEYSESQFLNGKKVFDEDFIFDKDTIESNLTQDKIFHYSNNFIIFNKTQENILYANPPLIIVGSAGSGKTSVTIEKLRTLTGKVLYVSLSQELVNSAKYICGEYQNIDFLSFNQFVNNIEEQKSKAIDFYTFKKWAYRNNIKEIEKYYEEFKGVLTADNCSEYISVIDYKSLGKNQSLFLNDKREDVYKKFVKYLQFLKDSNLYDTNIAIYNLFDKVEKIYDFIVIDEIQDFTNKEIALILKSLKDNRNFIFSGDSNQIIYSNFFSWSHLKTMLYKDKTINAPITVLQENYRNSKNITKVANDLLKIKQLQFGSIDKESNYLIETKSSLEGKVHFYKATTDNIKEINQETENSTKVAVIVFDELSKQEIKKEFKTALIYTVQEIKGLEYEEVILVNLVSSHRQAFKEVIKDIQQDDLDADLKYNRSGKKDNENRLESYKIYINSLYVALTRGIKKLYILEKNNHRLFEVLGLVQEKKERIVVEQSSIKEWEAEAKKLEKLGKIEQAEDIRKKKLKTDNIDILDTNDIVKDISQLQEEALNPSKFNKKAKDAFFQIVKENNQVEFIERLVELKYAPAKKYLQSITKKVPISTKKKKIAKIVECAYYGNIKKMKQFILDNCDVNFQNKEGASALTVASQYGKSEILKLLLDNGANPNLLTKNNFSALMLSSVNKSIDVVRLLLDNGANSNMKQDHGLTALMFASASSNIDIVKLLLEYNADIHAVSKDGYCALKFAIQNKQNNIAKLLLDLGANPNIQKNDGETALFFAAKNNDIGATQLLLENQANPNLQRDDNITVLMLASQDGQTEIVKLLLDNGANPNLQQSNNMETALLLSVKNVKKDIVELLLENGANPDVQTNDGITSLHLASVIGDKEIVRLLLKYNANPNVVAQDDSSSLILAANEDSVEIVELLLENGANPNMGLEDDGSSTALVVAYQNRNIEMIRLLLDNGAIDTMN